MSLFELVLLRLLLGGLAATVLGGVVWTVVRVVRPRPAVASLLWLVVVVKFAVPVTPFAVALAPSSRGAEAGASGAAVSVSSLRDAGRADGVDAGQADEIHGGRAARGDATLVSRLAERAGTVASRTLDLASDGGGPIAAVLLVAWLAGSAATLARSVRGWRRWRRGWETSRAAPSWLREEAERIARRMGVAPPRISLYPGATPAVVGVRRPVLLWPARLAAEPSPGVPGVVAHELAHVRRRDCVVGVLEVWAQSLWWWYPPARRVIARLRSAAEEACDAVAVELFPASRRAYAEALLRSLSAGASPRPAAGLALARVEREELRRRLKRIVRGRVPAGAGRVGRAVAVALALVVVPISFGVAGASTPAEPERLTGVIGRGAIETGPDSRPSVAPGAWLVAFSFGRTDRVLQLFGTADGTVVRYRVGGRPSDLDAEAVGWLGRVMRESGWAPGPADGSRSASGAVTPAGPHIHRTDERRTLAVWAPIRRPFDAAGRPGPTPDGTPIVVVEQPDRRAAVRLYTIRVDRAGAATVRFWEDGRPGRYDEAEARALTALGRRVARELEAARPTSR